MIQITFQKRNGEIFQRLRRTLSPYRIGEVNSYGWKVLDIRYKYKGKFYSQLEYDKLIDKRIKRYKRNNKIKSTIYSVYKQLGYSICLLILIRFLEISTRLTV